MQLNLSVSFRSKISTTSLFVGREIMTFNISRSMQPFDISLSMFLTQTVAKLNFCGLYWRIFVYCSKPILNDFTQKTRVLKII